MLSRKLLKNILWKTGMFGVTLLLAMTVFGCASFINRSSLHLYALDIDGEVFRVKFDGVLGQRIIINGETYSLYFAEPRPSLRKKIEWAITLDYDKYAQDRWGIDWAMDTAAQDHAVVNSIYPEAPENWSRYIPNRYLLYYVDTDFGGSPPVPIARPQPIPIPEPEPQKHPTLTPEELQKVELAYDETVRYIEAQGKRLYIGNSQKRAEFIRQFQGKPNTAAVNAAKNEKLPVYSVSKESENNRWPTRRNFAYLSEKDVVFVTSEEKNDDFLKVRIIHDWVCDIFAYDYDLLKWMDRYGQAEFTLGKLIERERGVCFEYAVLFCFLMNYAGVDTYLISDHSEPGIGHAYNMVVIDGTGYIVDTTWDSGNEYQNGRITEFGRMNSKEYFMSDIAGSYKLRGW
jgi:hypothetical protein